jgi:hypothetical protein
MHGGHADAVDPLNGLPLDSSDNRSACYRCHPGSETRCLRGVMGAAVAADGSLAIQCQSCHGGMSTVGAPARRGWLEEPTCQSCHTGTATANNGQIRYTSVFDAPGHVRQPVNATFATNPDTPLPDLSLYRFSSGHGGLACEACHGATHAEYPALHANDNVQSTALQGHAGALVECGACHGGGVPSTVNGGPHGMHPVGQAWVRDHHELIGEGDTGACRDCHGVDYRGTVLSRAKATRTLTGEAGTKQIWPGFQIGCYTCHDGPHSDDPNPNRAAIVTGASTATPVDTTVAIPLAARDPDGDRLTLRIVSQPSHGTVGLAGTLATYVPEPGFTGTDAFTFAAWDGSTDSNLATVAVRVGGAPVPGAAITGKRLAIKDRAAGPTTSVVFQSKDPTITSAGVDPRVDGVDVHVFNSAGGSDSACFHLAAANWRLRGATFRYKDTALAASPVKTAMLMDGLVQLTASGKGPLPITYRLGEPMQGSVGVIVTSGPQVWCANFGGTVTKDSGTNPPNPGGKGQFAAKNAPAPGGCPTPPDECP